MRSTNSAAANRPTAMRLMSDGRKEKPPSPQKASMRIDSPADAISDTTAGRSPPSTP